MITKFTDKNKFGHYTWEIETAKLFRILIHETGNSFMVEFQEWIFFYRKTHFSFISEESLEETILQAFNKVYDFYLNSSKYDWTMQQKENLTKRVQEEYLIYWKNKP